MKKELQKGSFLYIEDVAHYIFGDVLCILNKRDSICLDIINKMIYIFLFPLLNHPSLIFSN